MGYKKEFTAELKETLHFNMIAKTERRKLSRLVEESANFLAILQEAAKFYREIMHSEVRTISNDNGSCSIKLSSILHTWHQNQQ
ncbi:conserved hypothetical protein [Ricinus communis]|uniref:Uncharacterized protein n=1 Tax=Ricinus communis TaxID=3988 RepID=B9T3G4_RICCO|nr:conserved hypothetical protein [Ricinus communis]